MQEILDSTSRTAAQIRNHYETEKALANRLRAASRSERLQLYKQLYDELYRRVPDHPMLTRKVTADQTAAQVDGQMRYLASFLKSEMTVLEIGAGDCALSFALASKVKKVYGLEVSGVISERAGAPSNFELVLSDGLNIPVPDGSIDLAYSNNVMEHLHPEDAQEQLKNICRALKPGGIYLCTTPHNLQGPTDISQVYDDVTTCLHMKEYYYSELSQLLRNAGFSRTEAYVNKSGSYHRVPMYAMKSFERIAKMTFGGKKFRERQSWIRRKPFSLLGQGINIAGYR